MWTVAEGALVAILIALAVMTFVAAGMMVHQAVMQAWDDLQDRRAAREADRVAALHRRPKRDLRRRG